MKAIKEISYLISCVSSHISNEENVNEENVTYWQKRVDEIAQRNSTTGKEGASVAKIREALNNIVLGFNPDNVRAFRGALRGAILDGTPAPALTKYKSVTAFCDPTKQEKAYRPVLCGVYHDETARAAVATTGHILFVNPTEYNEAHAGKIIDKLGHEIEGRFPNWAAVIPADGAPVVPVVTVSELREELRRVAAFIKEGVFTPDRVPFLFGNVNGAPLYVSAHTAPVFLSAGVDGWRGVDSSRAICKKTDDGKIYLIMPMLPTDNDNIITTATPTPHTSTSDFAPDYFNDTPAVDTNEDSPRPAVVVVPVVDVDTPAPAVVVVDETNEAPAVDVVPAPAVDETNNAPAVDAQTADNDTNEAPHADSFERFINSLNKRDGGRAREILTRYEQREGVSRQRFAFVFVDGAKYSVDYCTNNNGTRARLEYIATNAEGVSYICTKYEYLLAEFVGVTICTPEYKEYINAKINYYNVSRQRDGWQFTNFLSNAREKLARLEAHTPGARYVEDELKYLRELINAADALARFEGAEPAEFVSPEPVNNEAHEDNAPAVDVVPAPAVDETNDNEAPAPQTVEAPAVVVDVVPALTADPEPVNEADTLTTDTPAPAVVVVDETNEAPAVDVVPAVDTNEDSPRPAVVVVPVVPVVDVDTPAPAVVVVDETNEADNEAPRPELTPRPRLTLRARHWLTAAAVLLCVFILRAVVPVDETNAHEDNAPRPAVVVDSLTAHALTLTTDTNEAPAVDVDTITTTARPQTVTTTKRAPRPHVVPAPAVVVVDTLTADTLTAHADSLTNEAPAASVDTLTNEADTLTADTLTPDTLTARPELTNEADTLTTNTPAPAVVVDETNAHEASPRPHALSREPDPQPARAHADTPAPHADPLTLTTGTTAGTTSHAAAVPFLLPLLFIGRVKNHGKAPYYSAFIESPKNYNNMKTYTTAPTLTASAVITALVGSLALCGLYLIQQTAHALRIACRLAQQVAKWLNARHNFTPCETEESEKVILTGWQYIGVAFAVTLFALVLSIDWDRTLSNL